MPKAVPGDPICKPLTSSGLELANHAAQIGSNLANDKYHDRVAFFPGATKDALN